MRVYKEKSMKIRYLVVLALAAMLLTGCDFFRIVAGRPTSRDLKAKQERLEAARIEEEAAHQARLEEARRIEQAMADSLAKREVYLKDSLSRRKGAMMTTSKFGGLYKTKPEAKYYIVVGAFRNRTYADRKMVKCMAAGFPATIVTFRSGINAVAVCPSESLSDVLKARNELKKSEVCPPDVWILVNE